MAFEVDGKTIDTDANGYMTNPDQWSEKVAEALAAQEGITMSQRHWDVLSYLRQEFYDNAGHQPNMRKLIKGMESVWPGEKIDSKTLYDLFPMGPAKQACKLAGLPETKTKGGY